MPLNLDIIYTSVRGAAAIASYFYALTIHKCAFRNFLV